MFKRNMFEKAQQSNNASNSPKVNPYQIGFFEKNLTWWVLGCIAVGIALGEYFPSFFQAVGRLKIAEVNMPIAVLIWLMIIPMLLKIDFSAMKEVLTHSKGIGITLFINWVVKPFFNGAFSLDFYTPSVCGFAAN